MIVTITEKPLNIKKQHTVKSWQAALTIFNKKAKESPDKNFVMVDDKNNNYIDTI